MKIIIVGATSGIGKELAKLYVQENNKVGITGRRQELLNEIKAEHNEIYFTSCFNVVVLENSIEKLEALVVELGGLDLLILSSGTGEINTTLNFEIEQKTIETNVLGFTNIADWAFTYFEKQQHGQLVAISSIAGIRGSGMATSYNATKAFQINYLEGLQQRASKLKLPIYVTDIRPGFVDTAMAKREDLFWVALVTKAAMQIKKAIEKKKMTAYITKRWCLIAIVLKMLPKFIYKRM